MGVKLFAFLLIFILSSSVAVVRSQSDDVEEPIIGVYFDLATTLSIGVLSIVLFVVSAMAYKHEGRIRLLFVMSAFFLFAVKSVLIALDDVNSHGLVPQLSSLIKPFSDVLVPVSRILDLGVLILFFLGLMRRK